MIGQGKYFDKQGSENVLRADKILHVQNVIKENENNTIRGYHKTDSHV